MKKILLLTFLYCFITSVSAEDDTKKTDSLLKVVQVLPHDTTRLITLRQIIQSEQMNDRCIQLADTLLKEASRQKNDEYASFAAYQHTIYYYNHIQLDSVTKWLNIMLPYVQKSNTWDYYFNAKRFQINLYSYQGNFEKAIEEATKMKKEALNKNSKYGLSAACISMGNAYVGSLRWREGIKNYEEAHECLKGDNNLSMKFSVLTQLIYASKEVHDNAKLIKYLDEFKIVIDAFIKNNPKLKAGYSDIISYIEIYYAYYYIGIEQYSKALQHLALSEKHLNKSTYFMYKTLYYDAYAQYFRGMKQYDQAVAYIDTTLVRSKQDTPSNHAEQLLKKANILFEAGQDDNAILYYQQALHIKDSLGIAVSNQQLEQIKGSYALESLELETTKLNNNIRLAGLVVMIVILLALFVIMFRSAHIRRVLKHSENEVNKAAQTVYETNEMKNHFLSNMSYNIRTPLNNVVGFSQLLANEPNIEEDKRKEYAEIIQTSSQELMILVNDVLDLSRLEARMMKFQVYEYDMVALCNEALYMARMKEDQAGINILFHTDIESHTIQIDTARITQSILSTLTYYKPCEEKRDINMNLSYIENGRYICIRVCNSPLADKMFATQRTAIRHEINQLLWEYFGGNYQIDANNPEGPTIVFTLPVA